MIYSTDLIYPIPWDNRFYAKLMLFASNFYKEGGSYVNEHKLLPYICLVEEFGVKQIVISQYSAYVATMVFLTKNSKLHKVEPIVYRE